MAWQFAKALTERGHAVTVAHGPPPENSESILGQMQSAGIETVMEPSLAFPIGRGPVRRLLKKAIDRQTICVIGINQRDRAVALSTAFRLGIAGVVCAQNQHTFWGPVPIPAVKEWYYARTMRHKLSLAICTSQAVQDEFVRRFGVSTEKTCVLSNGIDAVNFPMYSRQEILNARQSIGIAEDDIMLLNSGRIDEQKGLDILLDAVHTAQLPNNVKIIHVGDVTGGAARQRSARHRKRLQELSDRYDLNDQFRFLGWRSDVPRLLNAADGYVHSARWEGSPLAVLEAMAAGLPCVTPDNTSRPSGLKNEIHGFISTPEDPTSLGKAIVRLVELSKERRSEMGRAARQLACAEYDISAIGARFVDLLESLLSVRK